MHYAWYFYKIIFCSVPNQMFRYFIKIVLFVQPNFQILQQNRRGRKYTAIDRSAQGRRTLWCFSRAKIALVRSGSIHSSLPFRIANSRAVPISTWRSSWIVRGAFIVASACDVQSIDVSLQFSPYPDWRYAIKIMLSEVSCFRKMRDLITLWNSYSAKYTNFTQSLLSLFRLLSGNFR